MLIFDELKKNDPHLRLLALVLTAGFFILFAGLWWVQVVSAREYQNHEETQSYRTVRIPAPRGKILDREGRALAANEPRYNLSLYLDDLHAQFQKEFERLRPLKIVTNAPPFWKLWLGSPVVVTQRARLTQTQLNALTWQARYDVVANIIAQVSQKLGQPLPFDAENFARAYEQKRALPYPILKNLDAAQVARFEEQYAVGLGVDLDLQSARVYPEGDTAGHLLGYVLQDDSSAAGEDAFFNYRLPDFRGVVGIEGGFDKELRGRAGGESVLVNSLGYRQSENVWSRPQPGRNVVLTIDLDLQRAAEESLAAHQGTNARGAIVVMDVRAGDVLAMVSSPPVNPDFSANSSAYLNDPQLRPQINRATQQNYAPGSIFKPVVGLAALENGLDPDATIYNPPSPKGGWHGYVEVGKRQIQDTAPPGDYDFRRAIERSSNTYFITIGLRTGIEKIIRLAEKFHFGERTGLPTRQETAGIFPTLAQVRESGWHDGDSANICFGQGEMAVTPIQKAVAYAAIANGGKVLWPRLVERIVPQDGDGGAPTVFPSGVVRDELGVSPRSLNILRQAMLGETEDPEGTGRAAVVGPELRICGKTGTAQVKNERGELTGYNFWFASFAPYENPKYTVVVMVQGDRGSGGSVCAPIAHDIYEAILKKENSAPARNWAKAN